MSEIIIASYQVDGDPLTTYNLRFQKNKMRGKHSTVSTACIYCHEFRECTNEHFLQKAIVDTELLGTNLEPIFRTAICKECNNKFQKIDVAVTRASYLAETSKALKQELNFESNLPINHNTDNQLFGSGVRFVHYLVLDSDFPFLCRNKKIKPNSFNFSHIPIPLAPQIIFIWNESAFKIVAEKSSEEQIQNQFKITKSGKYSIDNVVEFCVPTLVRTYLKDKRELEQKFLKAQRICIVMPLECPKESDIELFYNSLTDELKAKTERRIEDTSGKPERGKGRVLSVPHTGSHAYRAFMRGVVKNAFHSFLYAYSIHSPYNKDLERDYQYRGSEPMFDNVKNFILKGVGSISEFIQKVDPINVRFFSNNARFYHYHYHGINFYITEDNIACTVSYFLGLKGKSECYQVLLTKDPNFQGTNIASVNNHIFIPFRVHVRSNFYDSLAIKQPLGDYPRKIVNIGTNDLIYNQICPVETIKISPW